MSLEAAINTLVTRLESVTARLEAVEGQIGSAAAGGAAPAPAATASAGGADAAPWLATLTGMIDSYIPTVVAKSEKIGTPELKAQVAAFQTLINEFKGFLTQVATCKKPADADLPKLLEGLGKAVGEVISIRDSNRGNDCWNHLSTLSELAPGFGWVQVTPTPGPHWKDFTGNSQFYSNKLIREHKGKDEDQMAWVSALHDFEKEMAAFIKASHTTGLVWNARGGDAKPGAAAAAPAPAAPKAAGPPPPMPKEPLVAKKSSGGGGASALFAELNKGGAITSGLKKVDKSQMTHKNPSLRAGSTVPAIEKKKPAPAKKFGASAKKGTPKFELSGNKWVIDFQENAPDLKIEEPLTKHTVYMYKCTKATVRISKKVNAITIDGCKKCAIVFENCVASVELVNCSGCEVQAIGSVPSFTVDKCSATQVVLSEACLNAEIVSAKSDQTNVVLPAENAQADITELAIPEQIKTFVRDRKLHSEFVEHV